MPEINFGKVKGEPFRYEDFTPEQLEGLRGYQGVRGTKWYSGNKINGTSTTENVFSDSGIKDAMIDDHYVNTENGEVYICTLGGDSNTAKWKFVDRLLITDQSLTKQNIPADAKAVGDKITEVNNNHNLLNEKTIEIDEKQNELIVKTTAYITQADIDNFNGLNLFPSTSDTIQLLNCDGIIIDLKGNELCISNDDGKNWETRKYADGWVYSTFKSMSYGDGTYVLIDSKNNIYTTSSLDTDITSWNKNSQIAVDTGSLPLGVSYGNNVFVLSLNDNSPAISENGIDWEYESYSISDFRINKSIYAKGKWFSIMNDGTELGICMQSEFKSMVSTNVSNFGVSIGLITDIVYVEDLDKFYLCGSTASSAVGFGLIASSDDAKKWDIEYVDSSLNKITSLSYSKGVIVAIGRDDNKSLNKSYTSTGNKDWKILDSNLSEGAGTRKLKYVVFGKNRFVAVGEGFSKYAEFKKDEITLDEVTSKMLINEKNESFNFGYLNGERGFYTGMERTPESFLPFIQNVPRIVADGEIEIAATSDPATFIPIEKGSTYLFTITDITKSNGAIRGYRTYVVYTSETVGTGVGIITKVSLASGGTSQLSITDIKEANRFGFEIKPNAVAYYIRYSLIKLNS